MVAFALELALEFKSISFHSIQVKSRQFSLILLLSNPFYSIAFSLVQSDLFVIQLYSIEFNLIEIQLFQIYAHY
jgi:hypothetical protein